jgi:hypothetical protein
MPGTIAGKVSAGGISFEYREAKTSDAGGGPRGIEIKAAGSPKGYVKFYPITPNPHGNAAYNNNQAGFYSAVATEIAKGITAEKDEKKFTALKPGERVPSIKGPDWTKLAKKAQDGAIAKYNKEQGEAIAKQNEKAYHDSIHTDLKAKGGKSVTWSGVSYKLPTAT